MNLLEWSEVFEDLGFNCFPLRHQSKEPAVASWKAYQSEKYEDGFKEGQNIAIICGVISKLIVIDLDHRDLANIVFTKWEELLHHTLVVQTSRGYHIYCRPRDGKYPPNAKFMDGKGRGIDIKSEGGYVVAPPSIHPDGGKYKVISYSKDVAEIDINGFVAKLQNEYGFSGGLKKSKLSDVVGGGVVEGGRNDSAYIMARHLLNPLEGGLDDFEAKVKLIEWNKSNTPPLEDDEINRIFESAHNIPFEERPAEFDPKTFKRNYVARHVTVTLHPKTLRENDEIYVYKNGLYIEGGETHIKEMLHRLYYGIPKNEVSELLATIRATTFVTNEEFDTQPELIHLKNCILNIKNLRVFDQTHELLTRNQVQTVYNPNARCPNILKFLAQIMPDPDDLKSLIELLSSILLHKRKLEKAIIFVGDQANGKSTLIEVIISLLGENNVANISLQRLASNRFATSSMVGKILNAYGDLDIDSIEQTGMIKQIISHDHIMVEKKNKNAFSTKIPIRLLYSANKLPEFPNADEAIYRRFWVIKFPIMIPSKDRDINLLEKLTTPEEKSGFLNILVANAHQILHRQFQFTHYQSLEKTKSLWREKSDSVSSFAETQVVVNPDSVIKCEVLYQTYRSWCLENNEKITSNRMFFGKLEGLGPYSKGYAKEDNKTIHVIRGCTTRGLIEKENQSKGQEMLK